MKNLVDYFDYDLATGIHPFEFSFKFPDHKEDTVEFRKTLIALDILKNAKKKNETCYIIAETGEWLLAIPEDCIRSKYVKILLSEFEKDPENSMHRERAEKIYKELVEKRGSKEGIKFLDWDLNKHHGTFSPNQCIYFYKDGKPSTLQPLVLKNGEDTKRLFNLCEYLWRKGSDPP